MKKIILFFVVVLLVNSGFSQGKYLTKQGFVTFFSHTVVEDIKADNHQVVSIIDTDTGDIAIQLLMKSFMFKKALMQEHFNENYVESHKYPKAKFKGRILDYEELSEGINEVEIEGILTVHGIDKEIITSAVIEIKEDEIILIGEFIVAVEHFEIKIPKVVIKNIAKTIKVNFELKHQPYKK
ncbi:MAG: YceI family protein [Urechidicola sp.]|nr:YceI family protein [Urechidicola sp.]